MESPEYYFGSLGNRREQKAIIYYEVLEQLHLALHEASISTDVPPLPFVYRHKITGEDSYILVTDIKFILLGLGWSVETKYSGEYVYFTLDAGLSLTERIGGWVLGLFTRTKYWKGYKKYKELKEKKSKELKEKKSDETEQEYKFVSKSGGRVPRF